MDDADYVKEPKPSRASWDYPDIEHLHGVPWKEAPVPHKWHRCWPQTKAWLGFDRVYRCACGAIRNPRFRGWRERNTRQRGDTTVPDTPYIERKRAEIAEREALFSAYE